MINVMWPTCALGELFEISAGKTMSAAARNGECKTPFLRTANVLWDEIDLRVVDEMAIESRELEAKSLKRGDLLVCEGGAVGRAAVWNGEITPISFQNHLHRLRPTTPDVEPRFYVYFLQAAFTQLALFEGAANNTTIPNLSRSRLSTLRVPHPCLQEQRAITAILVRIREAVSLNNRALGATETLKATTLYELFTRGLRGETQKETEIGPIPASWTTSTLGDLCSIRSGGTPPKTKPDLWDGPVPWVSAKDLKTNRLADVSDHISQDAAKAYSKTASAGSVLVLVRGMGLANGFALSLIERPMAFNQDLKSLTPRDAMSGSFLMHVLTYASERMLRNVTNAAHGTKRLTHDDLDRFLIPVPSAREQQEIVTILDAVDRKIDLHKRKKVVLEQLFKALLNGLMTGEITVSSLDLSALEKLAPAAATPTMGVTA